MTIESQLLALVRPIIEGEVKHSMPPGWLPWDKITFSVTRDERNVSGMVEIYIMHMALPQGRQGKDTDNITAYELANIASGLAEFGAYEGPGVTVDGREFVIGDGDDAMAVQFFDNAFHIWIRHFKD